MPTLEAALLDLDTIRARLADGSLTEEEARLVRDRLLELKHHRLAAAWEPYPWQVPPGDPETHGAWLQLGGRGTGKTEGAAHYVNDHVNGPPCDPRVRGGHRMAIVAPTLGDAVEACVTGPSGMNTVNPLARMKGGAGGTHLYWPNGAEARLFGCYTPQDVERLRAGGNRCLVWLEEAAAMRWLAEALTHTKLGLRIGPRPHFVISTTPKPRPEVRKLVADPRVLITKGSTRDAHHLDPTVRAALMEEYDGTRTGRQELDAEILDDVEGALWTQAVIDRQRLPGPAWKSATEFDGQALYSLIQEWQDTTPWPLHLDEDCPCQGVVGETCLPGTSLLPFAPGHECPAAWVPITAIQRRRPWVLVETVDPPGETAECGITIVASPKGAVSGVDHCVVLADLSVAGPPETWGQRVVDGWKAWQVPKVRVEKNQGQDMTRATIHAVDRACPVDKLTAVGSKGERANPVATLYWRGWVHHLGTFVKLEDQLATWVEGESPSPDRLDALVHGVTDRLPDRAARTGRTHSPNDRRLPSRGTGVGGATATFR